MLDIAKKLGFTDLKTFNASSRKIPTSRPKRRSRSSTSIADYIDQMYAKLPQLFGRLPKAKLMVMPVEEFREKEASGAQYNRARRTARVPAASR